ncbi:fructokinase [Planococcus lenghuensis]|uniref:Fructokinase n=1 Tax=Planococcus lenghuensis TaxID=2213202 RepID=A0A1Q2L411_9BACL|nr:carbohydrate kinase [Planococcus lenghuensis]AQQ55169.1 fructokinase [Planococcus lenghuensis]
MKDIKSIVTYGDAFIDYFSKGTDNTEFSRHLGGATVNVAAGAGRLGLPSAFITVTGDDGDSRFFREQLEQENVNLAFAVSVPEKRVSGVYVHLTPEFDRVFASYENETPDIQVAPADLSAAAFETASAFHFCSGTMFQPTALETTRSAVRLAKQYGVLCSLDVNIRPLRWDSEDQCRRTVNEFLQQADIVKMTVEELAFLTETESIDEGLRRLAGFKIPLLFITDGENGTRAVSGSESIHVPVVPVPPVDTTGAGDAFVAGVLRHIHLYGLPGTREEIIRCAAFGNKLGALCTTKRGALTAMPRLEEAQAFLEGEVE